MSKNKTLTQVRGFLELNIWWLSAVLVFLVLIAHAFQISAVKVDGITIALLVMLPVCPFVGPLLKAIRKLSIAGFEAEIATTEVEEASEEVAAASPQPHESPIENTRMPPFNDVLRNLVRSDHILALAKLRIELESKVRRLHQPDDPANPAFVQLNEPLSMIVRRLRNEDLISDQVFSATLKVINLCNRAIHGEAIKKDDAASVVDSGIELLGAFDRLILEFTSPEPVSSEEISHSEVDVANTAEYEVVTIVPVLPNARRNTYRLTQEQMDYFLRGYEEYAEFVISVKKL
ncbi:hypothetical protein FEM03_23470 [Phragmitibacter flavus]|uniref:DUF4145 domain-containing protein n=2 Tax=Phragmitibacter flavus TaxID=2576071 RepID=A0A5R8K7H2_9BACT|nr:hypothetical protein FEM03_23470 [Phragmitibacter flavus]